MAHNTQQHARHLTAPSPRALRAACRLEALALSRDRRAARAAKAGALADLKTQTATLAASVPASVALLGALGA